VGSARLGRDTTAKRWLALTIFLGLAFLGVKGVEYREKIVRGICPTAAQSLLHDRADIYYLSHLREVVSNESLAVSRPNSILSTTAGPTAPAPSASLPNNPRRLVAAGLVTWTETEISRTLDVLKRQHLLELAADCVHPRHDSARRSETLSLERDQLQDRLAQLERKKREQQQRLVSLQSEMERLKTDAGAISQTTELKTANANQQRLTGESLAKLSLDLTSAKMESDLIRDRVSFINFVLPELPAGLSERLSWRLPIVIPYGQTWASTYFLLTGFHVVHLLAGIVVMTVLMPLKLGRARVGPLENVALYWHFVDLIWLILFVLVYLL
jgi:cytochrome c oxidase subunit 3